MELRHLRYFVAVAEEENVSRAALKLHVSQPALSRQVRDLEEDIGVLLLERGAKSVRLTKAGRVFLAEARAVLERAAAAAAAARTAAGERVELHIGYAPTLAARILPRALRAFQAEWPKARVKLHDLSTEEMIAGLQAGRLQLAIIVRPTRAMLRGLRFEELAREALCLGVAPAHPLAERRSVTIAEASRQPLIAYSRGQYPEYHELLAAVLGRARGRKPHIIEEHDSVSSLIAAVEAGNGVALVPESLACTSGPRLKLLPVLPAPPSLIIGAAWRKDGLSAAGRHFLDQAKKAVAKSA